MSFSSFRQRLRAGLESPPDARQLGSGWISGVIGIVAAVAGFLLVIGLRYPAFFTMPELRGAYTQPWFRVVLFGILFVAYAAAVLNLTLRRTKTLGATAIVITLFASFWGIARAI
jgi:hypothetical protein